jgi:hypothetical protein
MKSIRNFIIFTLLFFKCMFAHGGIITGDHRFALNGGLIHLNSTNKTSFALSAEYEYKMTPILGIGAQGSYIFADNAITQLAAPGLYLHPLAGSWYISASPVFYMQSGLNTQVGARFTTYMPLPIGVLLLTPVLGVDLIQGGPNYIFGLGISI